MALRALFPLSQPPKFEMALARQGVTGAFRRNTDDQIPYVRDAPNQKFFRPTVECARLTSRDATLRLDDDDVGISIV